MDVRFRGEGRWIDNPGADHRGEPIHESLRPVVRREFAVRTQQKSPGESDHGFGVSVGDVMKTKLALSRRSKRDGARMTAAAQTGHPP
jgi:hypothetical protein